MIRGVEIAICDLIEWNRFLLLIAASLMFGLTHVAIASGQDAIKIEVLDERDRPITIVEHFVRVDRKLGISEHGHSKKISGVHQGSGVYEIYELDCSGIYFKPYVPAIFLTNPNEVRCNRDEVEVVRYDFIYAAADYLAPSSEFASAEAWAERLTGLDPSQISGFDGETTAIEDVVGSEPARLSELLAGKVASGDYGGLAAATANIAAQLREVGATQQAEYFSRISYDATFVGIWTGEPIMLVELPAVSEVTETSQVLITPQAGDILRQFQAQKFGVPVGDGAAIADTKTWEAISGAPINFVDSQLSARFVAQVAEQPLNPRLVPGGGM